MQKWLSEGFSWKFALVLCVLVGLAYHFLVLERARVDLKIVTKTECNFKIYWAEAGQDFAEKRMARIRISPGREQYNLSMRSLKNIERLRIDTHDFTGTVALKHLVITQPGHKQIQMVSESALKRMKPKNDVKNLTLVKGGVKIESSGNDPTFEVTLYPAEVQATSRIDEFYRVAILCCIILAIYATVTSCGGNYSYVILCLVVALVLVTIMAITSKSNVHPDEYVHVAALNYYKSHWLPPEILDEKVQSTYSPYGVSRLNTDEIYYFVAGKFAFAFEKMFENPYTAGRMGNVMLLLAIILYLVKVQPARIMALPLLISPQIWYLYSYCNSEAFALTIMFFTSCQVVLPDSTLRKYFEQKSLPRWLVHGVTVGLLLGCLLLLKKNFYFYTIFFGIVALVSFYNLINEAEPEERKILYKKLVILTLMSVSLFGSKKLVDYQVNGLHKSLLINEAIAAYAKPFLRPDADAGVQMQNMMLKSKGVTFTEIIRDYRWGERSFRSSFGVYGYLNTPASGFVYGVFRVSALLLACYFFITIFVRGSTINKRYALAALVISGLLVCVSAYHSWTADFQPQGRYLFPIAGMLFILCGQNVKVLSERWLSLLVVWMFCLSTYSFIAVALLKLPRNYLL
ncbi:hypothetical protein [Desulfosediminicola sp.]|uniref:hypothetical protein n=1 Tax=Desulfosediminicola sp. TaxID=2886825 RepID=UPI003AF20AB9